MKRLSFFLKVTALVLPLLMTACASKKSVTSEKSVTATVDTVAQKDFIQKMLKKDVTDNQANITSKVKFSIEVGQLRQTLTGNLKMKRDKVIRLQLMAFGFVEAARLEFTPKYALIMDRINKQYLRVPYHHVDFLRESGIDFYTLQALFWAELFQPDHQKLTNEDMEKFTHTVEGDNILVAYGKEEMAYNWLVNALTGTISMANITYHDKLNKDEITQLNWDYRAFTPLGEISFPKDMRITLTTPKKEVRLGLELNYLKNDSDWETETTISGKYSEVEIDEILRRFMSL